MSALAIAIFKSHHDCIEILLDAPEIDIELPTKQGMTPLQMALKIRDMQTVRILITKGAVIYYDDEKKKPLSPVLFMIKN